MWRLGLENVNDPKSLRREASATIVMCLVIVAESHGALGSMQGGSGHVMCAMALWISLQNKCKHQRNQCKGRNLGNDDIAYTCICVFVSSHASLRDIHVMYGWPCTQAHMFLIVFGYSRRCCCYCYDVRRTTYCVLHTA